MLDWTSLEESCLSCRGCGLCETRHHVVFGVGKRDADILFVGEGPGEQEDLLGEPFVGPAGKLLDDMPGLSFREYLWFRTKREIKPVHLHQLLSDPNGFCLAVRKVCRPLEFFPDYLKSGYYPFSFEKSKTYRNLVENVVNYIIDSELTRYRGISVSNTRKISALLL